MSFTIEELIVPESLADEGGARFAELVEVRNAVEAAIIGTDALSFTAAAILPHFRSNPHRSRRHFVATVDDRIVGRALIGWLTQADAPAADFAIDVLAAHRGRGIGSALLEKLEQEASDLGRRVFQGSMPHTTIGGGRRIASPTGFGDLPAADPGVRFLVKHGFALEMVGRISSLDLTSSIERLEHERRAAEEHAGPDYRVLTWFGRTPTEWLPGIAQLKTAMSLEEPSAGLDVIEDLWDAKRVREHEDRQQGTGRVVLTAAAEHVPSGTLAAYTEMGLPDGDAQPATQEDTLVLRAHRGRRLGMLLKAANAQHVLKHAPGTPQVTTFNAEDNRPMLDVNEALGFRAIGYEGNWQKRV